jgi:hypothetical protein
MILIRALITDLSNFLVNCTSWAENKKKYYVSFNFQFYEIKYKCIMFFLHKVARKFTNDVSE